MITFTDPKELTEVLTGCISYGLLFLHPDINPPQHSLQLPQIQCANDVTIKSKKVQNFANAKTEIPPAPPIPIKTMLDDTQAELQFVLPQPKDVSKEPKTPLEKRKKDAANKHWRTLTERANEFKKRFREKTILEYIDIYLKHANKWFEELTPKEQFALMRGSDVRSYDDAIKAWQNLDAFIKSYIYKAWKEYRPFGIKVEFLPEELR